MHSLVFSPIAVRDYRSLVSSDELAVRRALSVAQNNGLRTPYAQRLIQSGRPGLFSIRASQGLRLLASQISEETIAVVAIVRHGDFDRLIAAALEAATIKLPQDQLNAAASVLGQTPQLPDVEVRTRLQEVAPDIVQLAESSLGPQINWTAVGAIGSWVAVVIALITLIVAFSDPSPVQNFYINVEQVIQTNEK